METQDVLFADVCSRVASKVEGLGYAPVAEAVDSATRPASDFNSKS